MITAGVAIWTQIIPIQDGTKAVLACDLSNV